MDTITQITLGAAVGELTLGYKVGNKAILWGAVAGTIPDLDVLAGPFLNSVSQLTFHRGFTHSITFSLLFAPILGYLIYRLYRKQEVSWLAWTNLFFWSLVTHPLLDNFTSYGTQFFWPFSDYRVAFSTIFVIDPLYTAPFLLCVVSLSFFNRQSYKRRILNYVGISLSTVYLLFTVVNKLYINTVFKHQLEEQNIRFSRMMTSPTPLNNILWRGVVESPEGFWEGYYSLFDQDRPIHFEFTPRNDQFLRGLWSEPQIQTLIRITKGFYAMSQKDGSFYFNDMRYGRMNGWGKFEGEFVFSFKLENVSNSQQESLFVTRNRPRFKIDKTMLTIFTKRVFGEYSY